MDIFLIFAQNIDRRGGSNEYPQSMFWSKNEKKYMSLNATKCTFGHSDITSRKQQKEEKLCNMRYRNNTVFVIFEHWAIK